MSLPALPLSYTYCDLPSAFYHPQLPEASDSAKLVVWNEALSEDLNLPLGNWSTEARTQFLSGQALPNGIKPFAQAYAGHQFGHFTMLGDGRALVIGEWRDAAGSLFDLQWKGSGRTPFSRRGDGKGTLSSMLREFLISEAMHALGIPTTRSLAVVATGETIQRETELPGAMLVRIAKAHIRIGTFEWARNLRPEEDLPTLFHYTAQRLCPEALATENPALYFFEKVMDQHLDLVAQWMRVGFIHGVMNTDNMSLAGETMDYGPCAFMNRYDPQTVYSYIDEDGRYAFGNQPNILRWNFGVLAGAMLPLFHKDVAIARDMVLAVLDTFPGKWKKAWAKMMAEKLGLPEGVFENDTLIADLLQWMEHSKADYTQTFRHLSEDIAIPGLSKDWVNRWKSMRRPDALVRMKAVNPIHIPRNHWLEEALQAANAGQWDHWKALLEIIQHPYDHTRTYSKAIWPETDWQEGFHTFCGT